MLCLYFKRLYVFPIFLKFFCLNFFVLFSCASLHDTARQKKTVWFFFSVFLFHFEMRSDPLTFSSLIYIKGEKNHPQKRVGTEPDDKKVDTKWLPIKPTNKQKREKYISIHPLEINSKRWRDTISRCFFFLTFSCWAKWPVTPIVSSYLKSKQNSRNNNNKWNNPKWHLNAIKYNYVDE